VNRVLWCALVLVTMDRVPAYDYGVRILVNDKQPLMIFILGSKGFLCSALVGYCQAQGWEHAANDQEEYAALAGSSCDVLINADPGRTSRNPTPTA
jgi:hypothetical protein